MIPSLFQQRRSSSPLVVSLFAVAAGIGAGALLALLHGTGPLEAITLLLRGGFGCSSGAACGLLTTLQFSTPLLLTGLSALVALRSGVFSIGQAGQMLLGAVAAGMAGARLQAGPAWVVAGALGASALVGAAYAWIPGTLKARLGVNEVIVTLVMNQMAPLLAGAFGGFNRVPEAVRLTPLAPGTKLNAGLFAALFAAGAVYAWFQRTGSGYEQRMQAEAPRFAEHGGVRRAWAMERGMLVSGALAGLAGAFEVLGVHYRTVGVFSGGGGFDGLAVAALGQLHPLGVTLSAFILAGVRVGALNGLQIEARVPRELGDAMIGLMMLIVGAHALYRWIEKRRA